ncbi:MAG: UvrB/UvrC motif-containing protein [Treponema sp.]|nr:UvrB/UvrC motif-containing protein [Treponema sp.]MBR1715905.1 UvrB/UvrC motif-containing protein [Treponema sp.]
MLCSLCHENEACIFVEQTNVVTQKRRMCLCADCARQFGIPPTSKTMTKSLTALFDAFLKVNNANDVYRNSPDSKKLCPVCGISLLSIKKTRKVGCPECYAIFKDEINDILKNIGVTNEYTGSMPKRIRNFSSVLTTRVAIQGKLEESLKKEDYEKAAIYRDYLKALEKAPVAGDGDAEDE